MALSGQTGGVRADMVGLRRPNGPRAAGRNRRQPSQPCAGAKTDLPQPPVRVSLQWFTPCKGPISWQDCPP